MIDYRPISLRFTSTLVLSIVCLAVPAWADFEAGVDAYHRGDYATALREWRPQAEQGDVVAQFTLGMRYEKGRGCPRTMSRHDSGMKQWPYDICVNEN